MEKITCWIFLWGMSIVLSFEQIPLTQFLGPGKIIDKNCSNWNFHGKVNISISPPGICADFKDLDNFILGPKSMNISIDPDPTWYCSLTQSLPIDVIQNLTEETVKKMPQINSTTVLNSSSENKTLQCFNIIDGYPDLMVLLTFVFSDSNFTTPHIIPLQNSCKNVTILAERKMIYYNFTFPRFPMSRCHRCRSLLDTILGGVGTGFGVANSVDLEALAQKLRQTGEDTANAVAINARWLLSLFAYNNATLKFEESFLTVYNKTLIASLNETIRLFNWTFCALKTLHASLEKEKFQRRLTTATIGNWRERLNITDGWWIIKDHPEVLCTDEWCAGRSELLRPQRFKKLCPFVMLPLIMEKHFVVPQIYGSHIHINQSLGFDNITYSLKNCKETDKGLYCMGLTRETDPCLLQHSKNVCILSVLPMTNVTALYDAGPNSICLASSDEFELSKMQLSSPFSGCLHNRSWLLWNGDIYINVSLPIVQRIHETIVLPELVVPEITLNLAEILQQSNLLKRSLTEMKAAADNYRIATVIAAGQLMQLHNAILQDSNHVWWDFLFQPASSLKRFAR